MENKKLVSALGVVFAGYILGFIWIPIPGFPINFAWLQPLIWALVLPTLAEAVPKMRSLRSIAFILTGFGFLQWMKEIFNPQELGAPIDMWSIPFFVHLLLTLYFSYCFMSYLGEMAKTYHYRAAESFFVVRNINVIATALMSAATWAMSAGINMTLRYYVTLLTMAAVLATVVISIWFAVLLWGLRKAVRSEDSLSPPSAPCTEIKGESN